MALIYIYSLNNKVIYNEISDDIVILSPSLYWFKPCSIPTKNITKAKNIARHMMSDRPVDFSEIILYKNAELYNAYAYDKKFVKEQLKRLNLKNPKVYFANQLHLAEMISIDDKTNLYEFNHRVMEFNANDKKPTKNLLNNYRELLQGEKAIVSFEKSDRDATIFLGVSAGLFFLYILLFSFNKVQSLNAIEKQMAKLNTNDRSFYEIKSLIKKYKKLDKNSIKMKKDFQNTLKETGITKITFQNKTFKVNK